MFALMSSRREVDYLAVLRKVVELAGDLSVRTFVLDFEAAMWAALRHVFPSDDVHLHGCNFHLTQAIWRKIQGLGLATSYQRQEGTYVFCRKLMALAFLPAEHIAPVFDAIKVRYSTNVVSTHICKTISAGTYATVVYRCFLSKIYHP